MKTLRAFIIVSLIFLAGAITATAVVWYILVIAPQSNVQSSADGINSTPTNTSVESSTSASNNDSVLTDDGDVVAPIIISTAHLTDAQKTMVRTLGFSGDEIVVSSAAQICAEREIGSVRMDEIIAGATPTFGEGVTLFNCLKK